MNYNDVRELVRIRHDLRTLAARGERGTAATLLDRMGSLAALDLVQRAEVETELRRWRFVFRLEA